jgi:hypothetical protein
LMLYVRVASTRSMVYTNYIDNYVQTGVVGCEVGIFLVYRTGGGLSDGDSWRARLSAGEEEKER